jgi:hypothetical protein
LALHPITFSQPTTHLTMNASEFTIEESCPDDPSSVGVPLNCAKVPVYCKKYKGSADICKHLVAYYSIADDAKLNTYVLSQTTIPKTTFRNHWKASGLRAMHEESPRPPLERARAHASRYLATLSKSKKSRPSHASMSNRSLTPDEELAFVQLMRMLGNMGHGVTKLEALDVIDEYINGRVDKRDRVEVSEKILRGILDRNKDLVKVISAGSLDPQRAKKANAETRDAVFTKLNSYIKNLYAMKKVPWKCYREVPNNCIFNMDEVGTDTTKHRSKIIADAAAVIRAYQQTREGDDKMNMHITACLTTRADGK